MGKTQTSDFVRGQIDTQARFRRPDWRRRMEASLPGGRTGVAVLVSGLSGGLFWLVWIYGNGLRDPRYLDGWILVAGMGAQVLFHVMLKSGRLSQQGATRGRLFHIILGLVLIAAFISHSDFSLPDTGFEWALWACFVAVSLSGMLGAILAWSVEAKRGIAAGIGQDRIEIRRAELAGDVQTVVARAEHATAAPILPTPPYDTWIRDLYTHQLMDFFQGPRNATAHLIGSQRPLKRLTDEIDGLSRYVDQQGQHKLAAIRDLVVEKNELDLAHIHLRLTRGWLLVHVPVTYALIVLTVLHVLVVHAFSSGAW